MQMLPVEECIDTLIDYRGKTPKKTDVGIRLVTAKVIKSGRITDKSFEYIAEEDYDSWMRRGLPEKGDVLVTTEAPLGEVAQIESDEKIALAQRVILLRTNSDVMINDFLLYAMQSDIVQGGLNARATGTTVAGIKQSELRKVLLPCPALEDQLEIAGILKTYDNLIENNNRRIAILEEMAQSLYREWFVKFRFPGHQGCQFKDSPLGQIPEGWKVKAFTDIADVLGGGTPKTKVAEYWNGEIKFFAPKDAPNSFYVTDTDKTITKLGVEKSSAKVYPKDTVFITARGTVGKVILPAEEMAMNQSCYALRMKEGSHQRFLFLMTKNQVDYLKKNTGGATFDTIVTDTFKAMKVVSPDVKIIEKFSDLVDPIFDEILVLVKKQINLKKQRDILLPKLISGNISLSELANE